MRSQAVETVPLVTDADGVIRVGGTRVTLDTVVGAFDAGASAEEIASEYPLRLDDVYALILYYLRHREDVTRYLEQRRRLAQQVRTENESRFRASELRDRLLARRAAAPGGPL